MERPTREVSGSVRPLPWARSWNSDFLAEVVNGHSGPNISWQIRP